MAHDLTTARKNARTPEDAAAIAWAEDEIERLRDIIEKVAQHAPGTPGLGGSIDELLASATGIARSAITWQTEAI